jgi:hypothetical protein
MGVTSSQVQGGNYVLCLKTEHAKVFSTGGVMIGLLQRKEGGGRRQERGGKREEEDDSRFISRFRRVAERW